MNARHAWTTMVALTLAGHCLAAQPTAKPANSLEAITRRLATAKVSVTAEKQDPDKVLDLIRDAASVNIVVEPEVRRAWEAKTVTLKLKDVSALSAFYHLARQLDVVASFADEAFVLTTPEKAQPYPKVTVYDIHDITEATRGFRLPPVVLGSQVDPVFYYYRHLERTITPEYRSLEECIRDLDLVERPRERFGEVVAKTIQERLKAKHPNVSVSYYDGYLVVSEQPTAARLPITPEEKAKALTGTTGK